MPKIALETKEMRRRTLIDAAWRCVARGGYRTMTVDDGPVIGSVSRAAK